MSHNPLGDPSFYVLLLRLDRVTAEAVPDACPHCGDALHRGDYLRKPRGLPAGVGPEWATRFSLCCSRDGCRKRLTPFSVRFLARKVYVSVVVVLVSVGRDGITPLRLQRLRERTGLNLRTIERWLGWWRETFPAGGFWRARRGSFADRVPTDELPAALLARFAGAAFGERLLALLQFLSPITSRSAPGTMAL